MPMAGCDARPRGGRIESAAVRWPSLGHGSWGCRLPDLNSAKAALQLGRCVGPLVAL
jgi:hypothetical protein